MVTIKMFTRTWICIFALSTAVWLKRHVLVLILRPQKLSKDQLTTGPHFITGSTASNSDFCTTKAWDTNTRAGECELGLKLDDVTVHLCPQHSSISTPYPLAAFATWKLWTVSRYQNRIWTKIRTFCKLQACLGLECTCLLPAGCWAMDLATWQKRYKRYKLGLDSVSGAGEHSLFYRCYLRRDNMPLRCQLHLNSPEHEKLRS